MKTASSVVVMNYIKFNGNSFSSYGTLIRQTEYSHFQKKFSKAKTSCTDTCFSGNIFKHLHLQAPSGSRSGKATSVIAYEPVVTIPDCTMISARAAGVLPYYSRSSHAENRCKHKSILIYQHNVLGQGFSTRGPSTGFQRPPG
jgi:hypothetical protein